MGRPRKNAVAVAEDTTSALLSQTPETVAVMEPQARELNVNEPYTLEELHNSTEIKTPFTFFG